MAKLRVGKACKRLGITPAVLKSIIENGEIEAHIMNHITWIDEAEIDSFLCRPEVDDIINRNTSKGAKRWVGN